MDEGSAKKLQELTSKEPAALTEHDKAFLRARSAYLSEEQKKVYAEVLGKAKAAAPQDLSLDELKARGELVGVIYKPGMKKVDYQKAVEEAEQAATDEKELDNEASETDESEETPDEESSETTEDEEV